MDLIKDHPHISEQLKQIRIKLENYYKDICDIEFTIQDGKLYVLGVRIARRSPIANLKSSVDFFREGKISLLEALTRIKPSDLEIFLHPTINNKNKLKLICKGLPASPGITSGKISFSSDEIVNFQSEAFILVRIEISHEDKLGMNYSKGILTSLGGMTSHASLVARQMGKCCVAGANDIIIDYQKKMFFVNGDQFKVGDWITINGSTGNVYKGKAEFSIPSWKDLNETASLFQMLDTGIALNEEFNTIIGNCWAMRDYLLHNIHILKHPSNKRYYEHKKEYILFVHPTKKTIISLRHKFETIPFNDKGNFQYLFKGFFVNLFRLLSQSVGIGNHTLYFRPLLDPMRTLRNISKTNQYRKQLVSFEFFNINKFIPHLIDIYKIKFHFEIDIHIDDDIWFLDHTNIKGESLISGSYNISSYLIFVNDVKIKMSELPLFYNLFRKREYFWNWYDTNKTSYQEMAFFLKEFELKKRDNFRLNTYAHELGLLENNKFTTAGYNLIK